MNNEPPRVVRDRQDRLKLVSHRKQYALTFKQVVDQLCERWKRTTLSMSEARNVLGMRPRKFEFEEMAEMEESNGDR